MKKLVLLCSLLFTATLFAQNQGSIIGNIVDKEMNNEPLLFASVSIKDTSRSVQTNFHGNFEIPDIDPGNYTLAISYLGYETLEVSVEVNKNEVTEIQKGLAAKSIGLDRLVLSEAKTRAEGNSMASIENGGM